MEVVKIDERGRLLIPKKLREMVGIREGGFVEIEVKDEGIVVKPAKPVAQKYFGVFKVEKWPEDLDEFIVRAMKDWWSRKGM
ncbi:MAG: AbrB/MazE/SpoVT family DNA-binding domain-containing protein [Candidatus Verstraetearchaeota archaeon]|jgi:AbrB family looped-hinge helix DNA binding protein|nr:AbrB/MazE/SpoVT family DNA-binding domain-containing protein [Candidatus Verstraetearchaeota archaeon]